MWPQYIYHSDSVTSDYFQDNNMLKNVVTMKVSTLSCQILRFSRTRHTKKNLSKLVPMSFLLRSIVNAYHIKSKIRCETYWYCTLSSLFRILLFTRKIGATMCHRKKQPSHQERTKLFMCDSKHYNIIKTHTRMEQNVIIQFILSISQYYDLKFNVQG